MKSTDSPFKYFQLFFDDKTLETLVQNTRRYANFSGVGTEKRYPNVSANFMDRSRLLRCMSIMMRHGLRPSPSFKSSFKPESGFVSGDNRLNQIFNEYGWLEWQCFRSFFHISDPLNQTRNPQHGGYYKLEPLLSEMRLKMEAAWNLGRSFAIDEMTIGFQGRCRFKQRITYKAEGDGFQCDALCDDKGYTYSFYFRSGICEPLFDHPRIHLHLWLQIRQQARLSEGLHGQSVPQCEDSGTGQREGDKEVTLLTNPNPLVTLGNAVPSDVGSWPLP